jgi:transposase
VIRGLMSDDEWALFAPFLTCSTGRLPAAHRRVLDGVFWITRTGARLARGVWQVELCMETVPPVGAVWRLRHDAASLRRQRW